MSLSTHVLDTAQGKPAAGMRVSLMRVDGAARHLVTETITNADGRSDRPLVQNDDDLAGTWELVFAVSGYFSQQGVVQDDPPFLDDVTIRFTMTDEQRHYHVPLLISPWAYSTYRGS